jgi:sodium-independent sulfate anion transporter 11
MSVEYAKRLGKRAIGYPETVVPVASSVDFVTQIFDAPVDKVCVRLRSIATFTDFYASAF